ncbi:alpha/beta fold hydrolase [Ramlibacter sp. AW1]|uniref:Alpha/beta fold hydrolase n=1 Tax=Ramlibacter aurantiacus TaxID=2801330 RepID=A0A936ZQI4_9BURK|nr:alpha/beta hydrolase [Ramlibacter aurantiacus]MBL0421861.1 alpha/beta fold hydrolase [Ramlibacter aurantiacus]
MSTSPGAGAAVHPAIGRSIVAAGVRTNYHDVGEGPPLVLLHGSGAGVTGWENWHGVMPALARSFRVLVPDIIGFGFTERPEGTRYSIKLWVQHLIGFLDALGIERPVLVGNSFGGALGLALSLRNAHRVSRMVLMGTPAGEFQQRAASARSWYYEPSLAHMAELLRSFPHDPAVVTDEMVRLRHEVTLMAGGMEAYRKLFPEPGAAGETRTVKGIAEEDLRTIQTPILALHGRDDERVPPECGIRIGLQCPNADLHLFSKCGHWVQIERQAEFVELTTRFARS